MVPDTLRGLFSGRSLFYWQDKSRREVDFAIRWDQNRVDTVECKIKPDQVNASAIGAFRGRYPQGRNFFVAPNV